MTDDPPQPPGFDEAAFRRMFDETYPRMVAYARRRLTDEADVDDVVSETYAVAWRRRDEPIETGRALPWLYGIAGNVVRNRARARRRRLRLVDRLGSQPTAVGTGDPAERPGADLRQALGRLTFEDQEVLRLVAWEGLSHHDIGTALGCSTNAVGIRLHRARRRLAHELDEAG